MQIVKSIKDLSAPKYLDHENMEDLICVRCVYRSTVSRTSRPAPPNTARHPAARPTSQISTSPPPQRKRRSGPRYTWRTLPRGPAIHPRSPPRSDHRHHQTNSYPPSRDSRWQKRPDNNPQGRPPPCLGNPCEAFL